MKMNDNKLFNSPFEMELRILLLLSCEDDNSFSVERILSIDFITCYSSEFGFSHENLHGQNNFKFGELSNRRILIQNAIKSLVLKGLIDVEVDRGYLFRITDKGKEYVDKLTSDYAKEYKDIAMIVINEFGKDSDERLIGKIQSYSLASLKG